MIKKTSILILIVLLGGIGFYVYRNGWRMPSINSLTSAPEDVVTTGRVKASFGVSKRLSGFDISATTNGGVVTLSGQVPSESLKTLAGEIARDTKGVNEVKNEIVVNPGAQPSTENAHVDDLEIRASILEAFSRSPELGGKGIDVKVENRIVTLSGTVETPAQRNGAEQTAKAVDGVAGVSNSLAVTNPQAASEPPPPAQPTTPPADLAKSIEFELFRTGAFNTSKIAIKSDGDTVTLAGTVRSVAEQLLAEKVALSTLGVKKVVNELKVEVPPTPPTRKK
jgi:hyperosmotically inducible periplasmic protein